MQCFFDDNLKSFHFWNKVKISIVLNIFSIFGSVVAHIVYFFVDIQQ